MFDAYDPIEEQALQYRAEKEAWDACQRAKKQHWASLPESKQASILKLKEIMETHRAPKLKHRPRKAVNHKREGKCAKAAIREYIGWVKAHPGALNDEQRAHLRALIALWNAVKVKEDGPFMPDREAMREHHRGLTKNGAGDWQGWAKYIGHVRTLVDNTDGAGTALAPPEPEPFSDDEHYGPKEGPDPNNVRRAARRRAAAYVVLVKRHRHRAADARAAGVGRRARQEARNQARGGEEARGDRSGRSEPTRARGEGAARRAAGEGGAARRKERESSFGRCAQGERGRAQARIRRLEEERTPPVLDEDGFVVDRPSKTRAAEAFSSPAALADYHYADDEHAITLYVELSRPVKSNQLTVEIAADRLRIVHLGSVVLNRTFHREIQDTHDDTLWFLEDSGERASAPIARARPLRRLSNLGAGELLRFELVKEPPRIEQDYSWSSVFEGDGYHHHLTTHTEACPYVWTQSEYDVTVTLKTPPGTTKYDLSIAMKRDSLRVYIKGKGAVIDNVLNRSINLAESTWALDDTELTIVLGKSEKKQAWQRLIVGGPEIGIEDARRLNDTDGRAARSRTLHSRDMFPLPPAPPFLTRSAARPLRCATVEHPPRCFDELDEGSKRYHRMMREYEEARASGDDELIAEMEEDMAQMSPYLKARARFGARSALPRKRAPPAFPSSQVDQDRPFREWMDNIDKERGPSLPEGDIFTRPSAWSAENFAKRAGWM